MTADPGYDAASVWGDWRRGLREGEGLRMVMLPEGGEHTCSGGAEK